MAIDLSFLGGIPEGLLTAEQQTAAQDRARQAAALQLGLGMIAGAQGQRGAGKPGLAQIVAQAGPGAIQAYQTSFDQTLKNALTSMQLSEMQRKRAEQERMRQAISGAYTMRPTAEGVMATQTNIDPALLEGMSAQEVIAAAPRTERVVDRDRLLSAIAEFAPEKYLELTQTKPAELPASVREYQFAVGQGYKGTYNDFITQQKQAGAPSTKIDIKQGESIAAQIGPMLKDSQVAATGASLQIDSANRIINAVDTGRVVSGPGTTPILRIAQIGSILGLTGKDTQEVIANTRQAIRGLAELTLQGRKSMRGEGAITESEGKLAEKAFSGDIADLTNDEIKILANASRRAAEFTVAQHNKKLDELRKDPATSRLVPFYEVGVMPSTSTPSTGVKRYNPATGKVQ